MTHTMPITTVYAVCTYVCTQAGTPRVEVEGRYDAASKTYTLRAKQHTPASAGQNNKDPVLIPLAVGLMGPDGEHSASRPTVCICFMCVRSAKGF